VQDEGFFALVFMLSPFWALPAAGLSVTSPRCAAGFSLQSLTRNPRIEQWNGKAALLARAYTHDRLREELSCN
jgi:hypothetical protein